ncbi:MAG TPA: glutaredoxin family protein [Opitutaceae bacterium]|nr:glutaredoxin family protein [Opitutaceae bacterium]
MKTSPTPTSARSPADSLPVLYVKTGCPWCEEAVDFLRDHGIGYRERVVSGDSGAFAEMQRVSHQTKAPVLDWHGDVLADFGVDELVPFLRGKNVKLEDS